MGAIPFLSQALGRHEKRDAVYGTAAWVALKRNGHQPFIKVAMDELLEVKHSGFVRAIPVEVFGRGRWNGQISPYGLRLSRFKRESGNVQSP